MAVSGAEQGGDQGEGEEQAGAWMHGSQWRRVGNAAQHPPACCQFDDRGVRHWRFKPATRSPAPSTSPASADCALTTPMLGNAAGNLEIDRMFYVVLCPENDKRASVFRFNENAIKIKIG
jgi:hypothetical protein